ncbi:MAG TPA: serine hydrolase [Mycobacteriales bacterium]|nr:serine hydrolase [Mycobacteriales bacterium]
MRDLPARRAAAAGAFVLAALTAGPALAVDSRPIGLAHAPLSGPVGGPLLGSTGVVVDGSPGVPRLPAGITASSWLVADAGSGAVLAARDAHGRFLPASTLKALTAVTLIPMLDPNRIVTATFDDVNVDGSKVGLVEGGRYPVRMLFTAMLVVSGNDAANTLADAAGGIPRTLNLMNAEARHLHADDTVAKTPSGLDGPGESSSAYDLALIARAGLAMPAFRHYVATVLSYVSQPHGKPFQIYTHDYLLTSFPGAIGVKNGYTVAAQGTYIGAATRGGRTILVTLMHTNPDFWPEARALLTWGFAADPVATPVGQLVPPLVPSASAASAVDPISASAKLPSAGRLDKNGASLALPLGLAAATVVCAGGLARRGRRHPRRLRLPPI